MKDIEGIYAFYIVVEQFRCRLTHQAYSQLMSLSLSLTGIYYEIYLSGNDTVRLYLHVFSYYLGKATSHATSILLDAGLQVCKLQLFVIFMLINRWYWQTLSIVFKTFAHFSFFNDNNWLNGVHLKKLENIWNFFYLVLIQVISGYFVTSLMDFYVNRRHETITIFYKPWNMVSNNMDYESDTKSVYIAILFPRTQWK